MQAAAEYKLIVTIVRKGKAETVVEAAKAAGAEGATIMFGRGTGIHEQKKLLGIPIEPEKEIIFTVVPAAIAPAVLAAVEKEGKLQKPTAGIAFVLDLENVVGIVHAARQ